MSSEEESKKRKADELEHDEGEGKSAPSEQGHSGQETSTDLNKSDEREEKNDNGIIRCVLICFIRSTTN